MEERSAARLDDLCLERLRAGGTGTVHSVYRHCVNVLLDGRPVALLAPGGDLSCATAVLAEGEPGRWGLARGDRAESDGTCLRLGGRVAVRWDGADMTGSTLPAGLALTSARARLRRLAEAGRWPEDGGADAYRAEVRRMLERRTAQLVWALCRGGVDAAAGALVGLGFGLTPSGDDVLAGALLTLHTFRGGERGFQAPRRAVLPCLSATTDAGAWMLAGAAEGRGRAALARLLAALSGGGAECEVRLREVVEIGSTSGHDLCLGIRAGMAALFHGGTDNKEQEVK